MFDLISTTGTNVGRSCATQRGRRKHDTPTLGSTRCRRLSSSRYSTSLTQLAGGERAIKLILSVISIVTSFASFQINQRTRAIQPRRGRPQQSRRRI